jgi:hypothetical protein
MEQHKGGRRELSAAQIESRTGQLCRSQAVRAAQDMHLSHFDFYDKHKAPAVDNLH